MGPEVVHCYPTSDHSGLEFSAFPRSGGLVSPAEFCQHDRGDIPDRAVRSLFVVVPTPSLQLFASVLQVQEPVRVDPRASFFQTARSVKLTHLRRSLVVSMELLIDFRESRIPDPIPPADEQVLWSEPLRYFFNHIKQMPDKARQAFELRVWGNLSFAEIGQHIRMI